MSKLFSRATVTGTTLAGATLKTSLTALWDALNTIGITDSTRSTVTASATLATTQAGLVPVDCTSASVTLTLPTSGTTTDELEYDIRRVDSSANTLTVQRGGTDTIDGATGWTVPPGGILKIKMPAGGTNWRITNVSAASPATQANTAFTTTGSAAAYVLTPTPQIAALAANQRFRVKFSFSTTGASTLAVSGTTATALKQYDSTGTKIDPTIVSGQLADVEYDGTNWVILTPLTPSVVLRSYLTGLTLSTAGASTTMSIAAGQATDSTNVVTMNLASALNKTTSAWAVGTGNGGIDTGAIAASTWYYFYLIRRPDTGVVDVVFSLSSSAPTLPTNYTQYRYIGAGLTNGSSQWTKFQQFGDEFTWDTPVLDLNAVGSTTAALQTLSVPRGRKMKAWMNVYLNQDTNQVYLSDPANSDLAPSLTAAPLGTVGYTSASFAGTVQATCWTNTTAQIRHREVNGTGTIRMATLGWTDLRGKDL